MTLEALAVRFPARDQEIAHTEARLHGQEA